MLKFPIYLDYSATTPVDPRVAAKMIPWLTEHFGNPASRSHAYGWEAEAAVEEAREQVAKLIGADPREIVWTSGRPSRTTWPSRARRSSTGKGKHIITVKTEHKAVLDTLRELERRRLRSDTYLDVQDDGLVDLDVPSAPHFARTPCWPRSCS
jgi:cysteine desulfurase